MIRRRGEEKVLDVSAAMQGSLVFSDPVNLRINGKFNGELTTKGNLIIGEKAEVSAVIFGENISVAGDVKGRIKATKMLTLTSSAHVEADVEAPKVSIEEGAIFNGKCKMSSEEQLSLRELADYLSIEEEKIMEWVDGGRISADKEGDSLLFNRREVETWISQNQ